MLRSLIIRFASIHNGKCYPLLRRNCSSAAKQVNESENLDEQPNVPSSTAKQVDESENLDEQPTVPSKAGGFAAAFRRYTQEVDDDHKNVTKETPKTFASLLRNSKFIQLGDPHGKVVLGTVFHVVDDDVYIDFGGKFYCVCIRPQRRAKEYVKGAKVRIRILDLEHSSRFLGMSSDITSLEANASIIGLLGSK